MKPEVIEEANRWLASMDCTDSHVVADYLARAIIEAGTSLAIARDNRQQLVTNWARCAFGEVEATNLPQRGLRLLEEAIEAYQACGGDAATAHKLVAYVFDRPKGEIGQELGGVAVTVLALAAAAGLSAEEEECREVARVLNKPISEFTERNANKNAAGFRLVTVADEMRAELDEGTKEAMKQTECTVCQGLGSIEITGLPCRTCGGSGWVRDASRPPRTIDQAKEKKQ